MVRQNSVLFVGVVTGGGIVSASRDHPAFDVRFRIDEHFAGLPPGTKQIVVRTNVAYLPGKAFLVDACKARDGVVHTPLCSQSGAITDRSVGRIVDYLRLRSQGKAATTLRIYVVDGNRPLNGAQVMVSGPDGVLSRFTGAGGEAAFDTITPGRYRVSAAAPHFHGKTDADGNELTILPGTCASASLTLISDATVSGLVRDAKGTPVAGFAMELVAAPGGASAELQPERGYLPAVTSTDGRFRFDAVSPGRYLLGANITGMRSSPLPPTYYPGRRAKNRAVPLEVRPGARREDLVFVLPDYGASRRIDVCVIGEDGRPAPAAVVAGGRDPLSSPQASLGDDLKTDSSGCVQAQGYAGVSYTLRAVSHAPVRFSDPVVISPGEGSARAVLVLKGRGASPRSTR